MARDRMSRAASVKRRRTRSVRDLFTLAAALVLGACSPATLLNAFLSGEGYASHTSVAYGDADRQVLDVYVPEAQAGAAPVIVFFYGGSWKSGSRDTYRFIAEAFAPRGFTVVVPDYRLYPEVRFPAFVEDGARAMRWVRDNIGDYGGDPERIILMGHSAGAHIAALLAFDERYLARVGVPADALRGLVGIAGPYAFNPLAYRSTRRIFSGLPSIDNARPVTFVGGEDIAALLLHGGDDTTVLPRNTKALAERIRETGGRPTTHVYPETGHIGIVLSFAPPFRGRDTVYEDTLRFLRSL